MSLVQMADDFSSVNVEGKSSLDSTALAEFPLSTTDAGTALPSALLGDVDVFGNESVSVIAGLFGRVNRGHAVRPELVFAWRDRADVIDIDASLGVTSEMIEFLAVWNRAMDLNPCPGMATPSLPSRGELGIAPVVEPLHPEVASRDGIHFVLTSEACPVISNDVANDQGISIDSPAAVVRLAPASGIDGMEAALDRAFGHGMTLDHNPRTGGAGS